VTVPLEKVQLVLLPESMMLVQATMVLPETLLESLTSSQSREWLPRKLRPQAASVTVDLRLTLSSVSVPVTVKVL